MEKSCTGKNIYENLLNSHILFYENIRWLLIYFLKVYSILCVHVLFLILGSLHWTPNTGKLLSTLRNNHREVMQQCWIYSNCRFREEGGNCITTHKRSMSQLFFVIFLSCCWPETSMSQWMSSYKSSRTLRSTDPRSDEAIRCCWVLCSWPCSRVTRSSSRLQTGQNGNIKIETQAVQHLKKTKRIQKTNQIKKQSPDL